MPIPTNRMLIARDNPTSFLNALRLITVPPVKSGVARGARSAPYGFIAVPGGKAGVRGVVLGQVAGQEAGQRDVLPSDWDWLYELDVAAPRKGSLGNGSSAETAVDPLLAMGAFPG